MCTFRLSSDGDDASPRGPWATLAGARDALRRLRASGALTGHATVEVAAGRYALTEPVTFAPADSHTTYRAAPGARALPVFDGGRELTDLRETRIDGRRAWTTVVPEVAAGRLNLRSLFVGGTRRPRARLPKFSPDAAGAKNTYRIGALRFPEQRALLAGDHAFKPAPGDIQAWPSLRDAEIVLLHYWVETRLPRPFFDPATGLVSCERRSVFNLYESFNPKLARYYVDNLREALTEPGEWYVERASGRLTYLPLPGETLGRTRLVIPLLTRLLDLAGDAFNAGSDVTHPLDARPIESLVFSGLGFRHADWFQPAATLLPHDRAAAQGVTDMPLGSAPQAAAHVPAVIEVRHARAVRLERCRIELTGFTGLAFGPGCRDCTATRNTLQDLGGGGVRIGGADLDGPPADRVAGIDVSNNRILRIGRVFHQSVGVLLTHAARCVIAHNEIAHTCYTGVSTGWSWGYRDTVTRDLRIEHNHIHHIGGGVLSDLGGIYLLGVQPGTVVRGNHIHDVSAADYGGLGIYPDEGCSHVLVERNWVHDTQGSCFRVHFARELVVRDNVFARSRDEALIGVGRVEPHIAATLTQNLLLGPAPGLFDGGYAGDVADAFRSDANLVWFPDGPPAITHPSWRKDVPHRRPFAQWRRLGHDRLSVLADPRARETATTFHLPKNSPAFRTGFRLHDWSTCGPRPVKHG